MSSEQPLDNPFIEIRPPEETSKLPDRVEAYIAVNVQPKQCSPLLKELDAKQDALHHLKRVRKYTPQPSKQESPVPKKCKKSVILEVLLGTVAAKNEHDWSPLVEKYGVSMERRWLPGRPAESKEELETFTKEWPMVYFHKQSQEHKQKELELSPSEIHLMREGMQHAIDDARQAREHVAQHEKDSSNSGFISSWGAVIVCPKTGNVVARASDERLQQMKNSGSVAPDRHNPLCTSPLFAIQGVSRIERATAVGHGMDSSAFQKGQYLCTGYDLYTTREPGVFEAMALVHSRIRRVVYGVANHVGGGLGGTGMATAVHALPTNHHYRVFSCSPESDLHQKCKEFHTT